MEHREELILRPELRNSGYVAITTELSGDGVYGTIFDSYQEAYDLVYETEAKGLIIKIEPVSGNGFKVEVEHHT